MPPGISAGFNATTANPGMNSAAMGAGATQGNSVAVELNLRDVSGVRSAAFDVIYDPAVIEFVGWNAGDALEQSGQTPVYVAAANTAGVVTVGVDLTGANSVDIVGTRTLIGLVFRVRQTGTHTLQFQANSLRDVNMQVIGASWHAGTLTGA